MENINVQLNKPSTRDSGKSTFGVLYPGLSSEEFTIPNTGEQKIDTNTKLITQREQFEQMLQNAVLMTEMAIDLKDRATASEKYVGFLRSLFVRASKVIGAMQSSSKSFLNCAQKLCLGALENMDKYPLIDSQQHFIKLEYEKLLNILEKELMDIDTDSIDSTTFETNNATLRNISEKIKYLEMKQKSVENHFIHSVCNIKNVKSDIDEKYPENTSRESLIDVEKWVNANLPTVPEDIFSEFSKPLRSSSLSSLKNMRRVKLCLQKAASSEDEIDSDNEEEDYNGTCSSARNILSRSGFLRNIKEETPQE